MSDDDLHTLPGPVLLLAGPGTGKTYRLGRRLKYLIEKLGVSPDEITVITFTASAAANMRDRISDEAKQELFLPYSSQPRLICTMHSLGYKILRENAERVGLREPVRVAADDHLRSILVADAAQVAGSPRANGDEVASCRQFGLCNPTDGTKCAICTTYRRILKSCNAVDYDDQILLACQLLKDEPALLAKYRSCCKHLLVDEYQDINAAQFNLIRLLSEGQRAGLFVVGDDDQSIYSWRGGSPTFIRSFQEHFGPEAAVRPLLRSFRCRRHVLEGATAIVQRYDLERRPKGQFDYKTADGPKIRIHSAPSDKKEAQFVRKIVQRVLPSQDVLILVPQRRYAVAIAAELRSHQIPYSAPISPPGAGLPLIATLALWLSDNTDSLSLRACLEASLNAPASEVPSARSRKTEKCKAREAAFATISALWQPVISGNAANLWAALDERKADHVLLRGVHDSFSKLVALRDDENGLSVFLGSVAHDLGPWRRVQDLLDEVRGWVESAARLSETSPGASVRVMTFQGAKGLEAKVVIVVGLEEGSLPREDGGATLAEQSRLLFVSMTRAVNELHLFHARKRSSAVALRTIYGKAGPPDIRPSRFLESIPEGHREAVFHRA